MTNDDLNTIRKALQKWRALAYDQRWGGMYDDWMECKAALEALQRLKEKLTPHQTELPLTTK